jgi:exodeoxyribonuclease VII large subunit
VETSKGYADFLKVLQGATKTWGYAFFQMLFPSVLQGDNAVAGITYQLSRIRKVISHFDVVAIVRGGGGDIGLSCYNNHSLAREIALFPIPVITGIGHATNETVTELVAFENAITPTKLAEFLIQKFHNFSVPVKDAQRSIIENAGRLTRDEKSGFTRRSSFCVPLSGMQSHHTMEFFVSRRSRSRSRRDSGSLVKRRHLLPCPMM